jgi:uncharacterized protein with HEPN domain
MPLTPEKDQRACVQDMLDSARQAAGYVRDLSFDQFWDDDKTHDAVALRLQVVGEAAQRITAETAARLPRVPIQDIRGMRHRISHDYGRVNFRVVWKTVQKDLPPLIAELEENLERVRATEELARTIHGLPPETPDAPRPKQGLRLGI